MMKHTKFVLVMAAVVTVIYIFALCFVRVESLVNVQRSLYERWQESYVMRENKQRTFVNTSNNRNNPIVLSEGQGYGLYLTATAGAHGWAQQQDFDELLNYYLANCDYVGDQHNIATYLMRWRQYKNGQQWISEDNSATDGDLYIAFSLHQASKIWSRRASYYRTIERRLTNDILSYEYNSTTNALTVGDWANAKSRYYTLMRTSDVIPNFFAAFYESTHDSRWTAVKNAMLNRMVELSDATDTGLVPDFAWLSAKHARAAQGKTVASVYDGDYSSNACRIPMMLAESGDFRAKKVMHKLLNFFNQQDVITAGYSLAGKQLNNYQSNSFTAPLVFAASMDQQQSFSRILAKKQAILTLSLQTNNYYDATLTTMAVMKGIQ